MTVWPQLTYIAITLFGLGCVFAKEKDRVLTLITTALVYGLLYEGGFFVPLGFVP